LVGGMSQKSSRSEVPVVVVNSNLNALGVVRSLARGRMPIVMVTTSRFCPAAWSRYCKVVRFPSLAGRELIEQLKVLSSRVGGRPALILTGENDVHAVSTHREELRPLFRFSLPSHEMVSTLADKTKFQIWAEQHGFPVPRAVILNATSQLQLLENLTLPVVIKPGDKRLVESGQVPRAVRAATLDQAREASARMLRRATCLIVQEWIDGDDSDIYFTLFCCDGHGAVISMFSGRKLVCAPPATGSTAVCVAAPEVSAELEVLSRDFIARSAYKGLGSLEFKRHRQTGRFLIVEPTVGRTDWQEEIATLCGTNIPLASYWGEVGRPIQPTPGEPGPLAWRSSLVYRLPSGIAPPKTRVWDAYFRLADPLPGIYFYVIDVLGRQLAKRLLPANDGNTAHARQ
jgi:D-aspartate ligase